MRHPRWFAVFMLVTLSAVSSAVEVVRGPYLQLGTSTGVVVRWRTDVACEGRVRFGTVATDLAAHVDQTRPTTEHEVALASLAPGMRYFYSIGTAAASLAGDASYTFVTAPTVGSATPTRIWVVGDAGTADGNARAVSDAYATFTKQKPTDLWLMLGDNAYRKGTDQEYQKAVFEMYPLMLRQAVVWPTLGNHDSDQASDFARNYPYFDIFTLPTRGEAGGLASGSEHYYAFDHANIHFLCLDSMTASRAKDGAMLTWAKNDLAATTQHWVIAFWHHPPYSKGSHDSDVDIEMREMRENALPILEAAGVDLVLSGHSHCYERSCLLDGHYGASTTLTPAMKLDAGKGGGDQPYGKAPGAHHGAVYVVAGASGKISGGPLNHPAMVLSLNHLGSLVLEVHGDRLDATYLRENGAVDDAFAIVKATPPAK